ncbi:conserved exported hypothetical protein [Candidatus Terasakiella magnetica]|uniref:Uncharacterized protein n=1 Tax=Candidatus Terasakiella magnetica TaxID=1867952 RepID=A0A1C3RK09_9PROT|nr:transporter substrate-binding domain-containing protein [Candidatus Terasakiella magnetica]SCA57581.1 conserved exported hypothetical protein [Candidatus Terasakiella magnetica]
MLLRSLCLIISLLFSSFSVSAADFLNLSAIQHSDNSNISELVLREAYKKIGIEIFITPLPAKRSLHHSNQGRADGELFRIAGMEKTYKNLVPVPIPINFLDAMVMSHKTTFDVNGWESLKPYMLAIRRGVKFSDTATQGMKRTFLNSNIGLGRILLEDNQVDLAIIARVNGLSVIQQLNEVKATTDLKLLEPPLQSYPLYHYLHKRHAHLIDRLTQALKEMQSKGRIQEIRNYYLALKYSNKKEP